MNRAQIIWPVVALAVGLAGGYGIAQLVSSGDEPSPAETASEAVMSAQPMMSPSPAESAMHEDDHTSSGDTSHMHGTYEVSAAEAPSVSLAVVEDAKSGWNVMLTTDRFTFTPEDVNGPNVTGEGHAHLYVDGVKVARLYGPAFHYPEDFDGTRTFRVTLNANDHSEYAVDGEVIEAVVDVKHAHHE
jgi:hypothetical protein